MEWLPAKGMWLTKVQVSGPAGSVTGDLAVDASGQQAPSRLAAGLSVRSSAAGTYEETEAPPWRDIALLLAVLAGGVLIGRVAWRRGDPTP